MARVCHNGTTEASAALAQVFDSQPEALARLAGMLVNLELTLGELTQAAGRVCIESLLYGSAVELAGPPQRGKAGGEIQWHGRQGGVVSLGEQKLRVSKPRLRKRGGGAGAEVAVPVYAAMQQDDELRERLSAILLRGVSTRAYAEVVPQMAETCGVSRSAVSRQFAEASEAALRQLAERRFDGQRFLIIYIDGVHVGGYQVLVAIGVDTEGRKQLLGLAEGASENAVVVKGLLADIVARGLSPERAYLFIVDGSKALRAGIDAVFGTDNPVQRCRQHKLENVAGHLPRDLAGQVKTAMRAAWRLPADEGLQRLRQQADWLDQPYPRAAASLREGLSETFTINALALPPTLRRCLATTNLVESPHAGMREKTGRVKRWQDGTMVLRWLAVGYLETERHFRRIMGYESLWVLEAKLREIEELRREKLLTPDAA